MENDAAAVVSATAVSRERHPAADEFATVPSSSCVVCFLRNCMGACDMWGGEAPGARASGMAYWALHLLPAGMLLSALDPWPEAFYAALRIVVCAAAAGVAALVYRRDQQVNFWLLVFVIVAIISNPFVPTIMRGEVWIAYVTLVALFLTLLAATRTPEGN